MASAAFTSSPPAPARPAPDAPAADARKRRRTSVLLSTVRALLLEIGDNQRAVAVDWDEAAVRLTFFWLRDPSEADVEAGRVVGTELTSDFHPDRITERHEVLPFPRPLPGGFGTYVFARRPPEFEE